MRAVLDTSVLVSAIVSSGTPQRIYSSWRGGSFELVASRPLFSELQEVLARSHVRRHARWSASRAEELLSAIQERAVWVDPQHRVTRIAVDPDDNRLLEAAVEGGAGYVVTGDRHLRDLGEHEGVEIVTPARFAAILAAEGNE